MTGQDLCQTQDQVDHSGQDSRVVLDGRGKPAVTVSIEGMVSIVSSNIVKPESEVPKSKVPKSRPKGLGLTLKSHGPPTTPPPQHHPTHNF